MPCAPQCLPKTYPTIIKTLNFPILISIGYSQLSVGWLKIMQEIITLSVFVQFSVLYLREPLKLDYLWAGLCQLMAVYFMFREKI